MCEETRKINGFAQMAYYGAMAPLIGILAYLFMGSLAIISIGRKHELGFLELKKGASIFLLNIALTILLPFVYFSMESQKIETQKKVVVNAKDNTEQITYFWDNGKKWIECTKKEGKLHGTFTEYNTKGNKYSVTNYKNGIRHGRYTKWHWYEGLIEEIGHYNNNKLVGVWREWLYDGQLRFINIYDDNGNLLSDIDVNIDDGNSPSDETLYGANREITSKRFFDKNGNLIKIDSYDGKGNITNTIKYDPPQIIDWEEYLKQYELTVEEISELEKND